MVSILLPLYIYPTDGSWAPLLSVAQSHPAIDFTVIVNPSNGPGPNSLPDSNYVEALKDFHSCPNVHLIGYVCCCYGDRDTDLIENDIDIYSNWEDEFSTLANAEISLDGIFFDEVPAELEYIELMHNISSHVRQAWADELQRNAKVIFNPGVVVDDAFYDQADLIVAFEDAEKNWVDFLDTTYGDLSPQNRAKSAAIVHTYQGTVDGLGELVEEILDAGLGGVFVTDQTGGLYNEWPEWWDSLIEFVSFFPETVAAQ